MAMEEFQSKYSDFYGHLTAFVNGMVTKLKADVPSELQYVTILPDILPLDDPDFEHANEEGVVQRACVVLQLCELVVERAKQFVDDEGWFDDEANMVNVYMTLVNMNLATLRMSDVQSVEFLDAGIGAINTGFSTYREINVDNLKALWHTLVNSPA